MSDELSGAPGSPPPSGSRPNRWPSLAAILICFALAMAVLSASLRHNQGRLVYALDDAYIHMAIAKNLVEHDVFGVTRHEFTFSSSSPLWTLLEAGVYRVTGPNEVTPLLLNLLSAALLLAILGAVLARHIGSPLGRFFALLLAIYLIPVVPLILSGMEHTLQVAGSLALLSLGSAAIAGAGGPAPVAEACGSARSANSSVNRHARSWLLYPVAALAVAARYESLFLVAPIALLLLLRKRAGQAVALALCGLAPVAIAGAVSASHGGPWLPWSLLLKAVVPDFSSPVRFVRGLGYTAIQRLASQEPLLLLIVLACTLVLFRNAARLSRWSERQVAPTLVILTVLLHVQFARTGWFHRYEAYLVAIGLASVLASSGGRSLGDWRNWARQASFPRAAAAALLVVLLFLPFHYRAKAAWAETVPAMGNIHEQQYQMGRFLRGYYQGESVAANDIGAINYLADLKCLDLWGLGTQEIARARRRGTYTTELISTLSRREGTRIAIAYREAEWFKRPPLPAEWIPVGRWTISHNIVCGGETVEFFATRASEVSYLASSLQAFSGSLPPRVRQAGLYREAAQAPSVPDAGPNGGHP